jgi:hypothetical protein
MKCFVPQAEIPPNQPVFSISGLRLVSNLLAVAASKPSMAHVQHRHASATLPTDEPATMTTKMTRGLCHADPMGVKPDVYREVVVKCFNKSLQPNLTVSPPVKPFPASGNQITVSGQVRHIQRRSLFSFEFVSWASSPSSLSTLSHLLLPLNTKSIADSIKLNFAKTQVFQHAWTSCS